MRLGVGVRLRVGVRARVRVRGHLAEVGVVRADEAARVELLLELLLPVRG